LGQGKEFEYRAAIQKIDTSDVYKIELQPTLIAKCTEKGLYDIRLIDNHGKYVAYTISNGISSENQSDYIDFPATMPKSTSDTVYIAENVKHLNISQLWLKLRNTIVDRSINLEGSDNGKQWFAIKENINLQPARYEDKLDYEQMLTFPESNYRYFKIQITGKNKVPVKIVSSGVYVNRSANTEYSQLPPAKFSIKNKEKVTSIFVQFDQPYLINKLHLEITAPKFYRRKATVYDQDAKDAILTEDVLLGSSGTQDIPVSAKTRRVRIDIANGDDNPLTIKSVSAWQQKLFAVSYLEKGKDYHILAGDSSAQEVSYDLTFFDAKPLSAMRIINHSEIEKNPAYATAQPVVKRNFTLLLWIAIVTVLILLSFLTWKMVSEINAKQKTSG